ncbi:MAG TPA: pyridoxamine 5'-phosphate oxidase [Flavobacterium sp.]|jgi:pyridoxamine 5'-phosphate oxidase
MKDLSNHRKSYGKSALTEELLPANPLFLFDSWFKELEKLQGRSEINIMTVSSIGLDGFPKSRIVLLKKYSEEGFTFFTNYNSAKGKAISANPKVCISFFWEEMERQVIVKGIAERTTEEESDAYFNSRPIGSKLGAIASDQSEVIESREWLDRKLHQLESALDTTMIKRPVHWGGYIVRPVEIEFWQGRANRMHDRIIYKIENDEWVRCRLSP